MEASDGWRSARLIDGVALKQLSGRSPVRWLAAAGREWATILLLMVLCEAWRNPLLWAAAMFVIGTRQHALAILVHDAAHFLAVRSRPLNDALANWLAAYPLFFPVQGYRTNHLEHHRLLELPVDPERITIDAYPDEFTFPMPRKRLCWLLLRDLIGGSIKPMSTLIHYVWAVPGGAGPHVRRIVALHAFAAAVSFATGHLMTYLLLWVAPAFTSFTLCFRLRTAAEHSGICPPGDRYMRQSVDPLATTRTLLTGPVARYLFSPFNISYHLEHHLYASVPWFQLRSLHRRLLEAPEYASRAHLTYGLGGLMHELTADTPERNVRLSPAKR